MENSQEENEPIYTTSWDDSGWWFIHKLTYDPKYGFVYKVWLSIEGEQDDEKAKLITESLNQPPIDIITSSMEGALDVVYENDEVLWSHVKRALQSAFKNYPTVVRAAEEFISKRQPL